MAWHASEEDVMQREYNNSVLTITLEGRIDSGNADETESQIMSCVEESGAQEIVLDAIDLVYISSAGLRIIMKLLKRMKRVSLINASPAVYDVFDMTGISQMMDVRKAPREVSIDGLELIGAGANGRVYRLDQERIIKVYNPITNTPEKIFRERDASRKAFIHGIPSAISFELVRVGESYGIIYEMIDAQTLGQAISRHPKKLEEYATRMAELLKSLHSTEFEKGELPDARLSLHVWADITERCGLYPEETVTKMRTVIDAIPEGNTFVHGDFHPGNIMVTDDDELVLIDMGDASMGDPIVDLLGCCQIMLVMQRNADAVKRYTAIDIDAMRRLWDIFIRAYYGTDDDATIEAIEQRLMFYALIRSMPGISFTATVPDEMRPVLAKQVNDLFLAGYDRVMGS